MCVTVWVLRYKNKKKRGSGNNRVYRNLNELMCNHPGPLFFVGLLSSPLQYSGRQRLHISFNMWTHQPEVAQEEGHTRGVTAPSFELTSQRQKVSRLPTEPLGRLAIMYTSFFGNNFFNVDKPSTIQTDETPSHRTSSPLRNSKNLRCRNRSSSLVPLDCSVRDLACSSKCRMMQPPSVEIEQDFKRTAGCTHEQAILGADRARKLPYPTSGSYRSRPSD